MCYWTSDTVGWENDLVCKGKLDADSGRTHHFQFPSSDTLYYTHKCKKQHGSLGHESLTEAETAFFLCMGVDQDNVFFFSFFNLSFNFFSPSAYTVQYLKAPTVVKG